MQYLGLTALKELWNGFVNDRQVVIAVMGISLRLVTACSTLFWRLSMNLAIVSLTIGRLRFSVMGISLLSVMACSTFCLLYTSQYLGLSAFSELGNCFVNDRQVEIAVMGISLRWVMACTTLVWQVSMDVTMVSLTIGRLILRLWVYRYHRLWHSVHWSDSFQWTWQWFR